MDRKRHTCQTAMVHSKIWLNFIDWSCNVFHKMFSKEEVNSILEKTISKLLLMFKRVTNRQGECIGVRNFHHVSKRAIVRGNSVCERLDDMMIQFQHKVLEDQQHNQNVSRTK